jgi:hypothetical protein
MWPFRVIDNFLQPEHFDYLCSIPLPHCESDQWLIYKNQFYKNGEIKQQDDKTVETANKLTLDPSMIAEIANTYNPQLFDLLQTLAPEKIDQYKFTELNLVVTGKDYKFPIHNDIPSKLLSVVIYLLPEKNSGTWIYASETGDNALQIEWLPNRALIFSRTENTWHSYQGDGITPRFTLVYNLKS